MAWIATDTDGESHLFEYKPQRWSTIWVDLETRKSCYIPEAAVKKILGRKLTWEDETVCIIEAPKFVYLACIHDRHTDDKYLFFLKEEEAKHQCREWTSMWRTEENEQYGDWCLYMTDDYYAFVQKVPLVINS